MRAGPPKSLSVLVAFGGRASLGFGQRVSLLQMSETDSTETDEAVSTELIRFLEARGMATTSVGVPLPAAVPAADGSGDGHLESLAQPPMILKGSLTATRERLTRLWA